jgi:hypothetical protein
VADLEWADIVEISHDDAKQGILDQLDAQDFGGNAWQEGDAGLLGVEIGADIQNSSSRYAVFLKKSAFNDTATKEALTNLSRSRFGNTRIDAIAAQRSITLTVASGSGPYAIDLNDIVLEDEDGHQVHNVATTAVTYPVNLTSAAPLTLTFEALVPGSDSDVPADSYTSLVTTYVGVTVTDDTPSLNGAPEESDTRLRLRNSTKVATRSLEPVDDTIVNLALEVAPTVYTVKVDSENPRGAGTFDVYLAGELATATSTEVNAVQAALDARVMGDTSGIPSTRPGYAQAASTQSLDVTGTVYYDPIYSSADVAAAVVTALTNFLKTIPLGGFIYSTGLANVVPINEIESAIKGALVGGQSGAVKTVALTTPAGNVAVTSMRKVIQGTWNLTYTASSS